MAREVEWARITAPELRAIAERGNALAILPVGSLEQHGPHLPVITDTASAVAAAVRGARLVAEDVPLAVLPGLWLGMSEHHLPFGGTITLDYAAYHGVLRSIVRSLKAIGFMRLLIVNGHGGNVVALVEAVQRLRFEGRDVTWLPCVGPGADAHAGHTETSLLLYLSPDQVRADRAVPGNGAPLAELLPAMRSGGVAAVSAVGVLGDPTTAGAADGRRLFAEMSDSAVLALDAWAPGPNGML